jgi:tetratricopeptide (TPR) repeat protein
VTPAERLEATGQAGPAADGKLPAAVAGAVLLALVLLAYLPVLDHQFVWDDHEQVVTNSRLRSWSELPSLFGGDVLALTRAGNERSSYYRPLFLVHYLVNYQLFGSAPVAWHALALLHHWLASFLSWHFTRRLGLDPRAALAVAALFALHPAHGESVAWVAAAFNDPPAASLTFVALLGYLSWLRGGPRWTLAGAAAAYLAALGFKESAIALLALVPLVHATLAPGDSWRRRGSGLLPFAGVTALYLAARAAALGALIGYGPADASFASLAATLPRLLVTYLRLLLWPWHFAPTYPLRWVEDWTAFAAWGSALLVFAVAAGAWRLSRGRPLLGFALAWIPLCLAPALHVRSFRPTYLVHQRYLYLAVFGLALAIVLLAVRSRFSRRLRAAGLGLLLALWGASLWAHHRYWRTDLDLWQRIAEVDPGNAAAFDWLGSQALAAGDTARAEELYRRSIAADPDSAIGLCNLARMLHLERRDPASALPLYREALTRLDRTANGSDWRPACEVNYGLALAGAGDRESAIARLLATAAKPPYPPLAARNAAVLLVEAGRIGEARRVLAAVLARHPGERGLAAMLGDIDRGSVRPR